MYILLLLGVLLIWKLQGVLFDRIWDNKLSVRLTFTDTHIYEGDKSTLKEVVVNDKRFPIPALHVRLAVPRQLMFSGEARENSITSDQFYKKDVFSFLGRQQITRTLPFVGTQRGYYELNNVDVVGNDFFFRESRYLAIPQHTALYVFPSQVSTNRIQLVCREISGAVLAQNRLHPDPFEFSGIRDYEKTDPMNHVNWKASARTGSLMVNQFDSTTNVNVSIVLDVEDNNILRHERLVEEGIRIASSLAGRMVNQKMPVRVCSDAKRLESDQPIDLFLPAGGSRMMDLNQELACIDSKRMAMTCEELVNHLTDEKISNHTFVLLTKNTALPLQEAVKRLTAADNRVIWVNIIYDDDEPKNISIPSVNVLRWEVSRW